MTKTQNLYTEKINEYVDWITGIDSITKQKITDKQISGKSIRDLLQERLQCPIYMYYDQDERLYRIFSSKEAFELWNTREENPELIETLEKLELYNFIAPSPYSFNITDHFGNNFNTQKRYVRTGISNDQTVLQYMWELLQDDSHRDDGMIVTYTIDNNGQQSFIERYSSAQQKVTIDLFQYLSEGENRITVSLKGEETKAVKVFSFVIECITLSISSNFNYYQSQTNNQYVQFIVDLKGPGTALKYIKGYLDYDEIDLGIGAIPANTTSFSDTVMYYIQGLSEGVHNLQIVAFCNVDGKEFYSNTLYYEFVLPENSSDSKKEYILIAHSIEELSGGHLTEDDEFTLNAIQYQSMSVSWGYSSNSASIDTVDVKWSIVNDRETEEFPISKQTGIKDTESSKVSFIPSVSSKQGSWYLKGITSSGQSKRYKLYIGESTYKVVETTGAVLKLSARGKSNDDHTWTYNDVETEFNDNFTWDTRSGWNNDALLIPEGCQAVVKYAPLSESDNNKIKDYGRTIEIEFSTQNVGDQNEELVVIGGGINGAKIAITPNSAYFKPGNQDEPLIKTNFKDNERVKLAFVIYRESNVNDPKYNKLITIINNGIFERVSSWEGGTMASSDDGYIKLGSEQSTSTINIYSIRCYNKPLSSEDEFNNYAFDSTNTATILSKNNVFNSNNQLDFDLVKTKIDTILITGKLNNMISDNASGDVAKTHEMAVTLQRISLSDPKKNFIIKNCRIRKHGQSTLNYPVPSFKFWSDSTDFKDYYNGTIHTSTMYAASSEEDCIDANIIYKGKYTIKDGIPVKKWVLQANYADSSGAHNGSLLRLINDTWYNAQVDGQYKLRTPPQLFTTNQLVDGTIDGTLTSQWGNKVDSKKYPFPYQIRIAPDSLPCVLFYREDENSEYNFVGQYVLMDDKKADYIYGERSIYNIPTDPFCLLEANKDKDTSENCLWDNKNVLQIEVLNIDSQFVDYRGWTDSDGNDFDSEIGPDEKYITKVNWEKDFELIYPDKDDITSKVNGKKEFDYTKFRNKVKPFENWYKWLSGTFDPNCSKKPITDPCWANSTKFTKFKNEASQHLDLYKLAAYYIYVLRFGLVDSMERNAQIKTYDGKHFWYEPWDMDIALGNRNTGGIAFDPPMDRDTPESANKNAISGRTPNSSNWLFDALEAWDEWINDIVPKVAKSLYAAGLRYDNVINMFDDNYSGKWCERIYNLSGDFKYIKNGGGDYYPWCQGARTTHRHWWVRTSMDYWDARWKMGDFLTHSIYAATSHAPQTDAQIEQNGPDKINIVSSTNTYFMLSRETSDNMIEFIEANKGVPAAFDISKQEFSTKAPMYIYGALYIQELDLSKVYGINVLNLSGCYSTTTGSNLRKLTIGASVQDMMEGKFNNNSQFTIGKDNSQIDDSFVDDGEDTSSKVLRDLQSFNMQGYTGISGTGTIATTMKSMTRLREFYGIGSGLTTYPGIGSGTHYDVLQLPDTIQSLRMYDCSWDEGVADNTVLNGYRGLTFWKKTKISDSKYSFSLSTPFNSNLVDVKFTGNTATNDCARKFILNWIDAIDQNGWNYAERTLLCDNVNWPDGNVSYDQVLKLAKFNNGRPKWSSDTSGLKGYIMLSNTSLTEEQIQNLQTIFGDSVFSKNAGGLAIDYSQDKLFVTIGNPAYKYSDGMKIKEGYNADGSPVKALLKATRFRLRDEEGSFTWSLLNQRGLKVSGNTYCGAYIATQGGSKYICVPNMMRETSAGTKKDVEYFYVKCEDDTGWTQSIKIYVDHENYPKTTYTIGKYDGEQIIQAAGYHILSNAGEYKFELKFDDDYTQNGGVAIKQYNWTLSDTLEGDIQINDSTNSNKCTLQVNSDPDTTGRTTQLKCAITFISGEIINIISNLKLIQDSIILDQDSNDYLYAAMEHKQYAHRPDGYSAFNVGAIQEFNLLEGDEYVSQITSFKSTVTDYYTGEQNTYNVLEFLAAATSIDISGCSGIKENYNFSDCTDLRSINLQNTSVGVTIKENNKISSVMLGSPTVIDFRDNNSMHVQYFSVQDYVNIKQIALWNLNKNSQGAFNVLGEILNVPSYIQFDYRLSLIPINATKRISAVTDASNDANWTITGLTTEPKQYQNIYYVEVKPTVANTEFTIFARSSTSSAITYQRTYYASNGTSSGTGATVLSSYNCSNKRFRYNYCINPSTQYLSTQLDLSNCTGINENVLSIGSNISNWIGSNIHIIYNATTKQISVYGSQYVSSSSQPQMITVSDGIVNIQWKNNIVTVNGYTFDRDELSELTESQCDFQLGSMLSSTNSAYSNSNATINYVKILNN